MDTTRSKGKGGPIQTKIVPWVNENLFSDHFIEKILPKRVDEWGNEERIRKIFKEIKRKYSEEKEYLEGYIEAQLEEHFIKPVVRILGHHYEVQEKTRKTRKQPDYAFFPDEKSRRGSHSNKGEKSFYRKAIGVGDAKAWEKSLDKKLGKGAAFEDQNPSFQIDTYLRETAPEWAILTNGRHWRIYYQETSYRLDSYFEIDLADMISKDDLELFKYFYFLFRLEAFLPDETGKNFLDMVYEESLYYTKELGEDLQENAYRGLKILAEGFLDLKENDLKKRPKTIKEIHDNSLVFLYRLLFILHAESRGLLDLSNETYNKGFSLNSIKHAIAEKIDKGADFTKWRKHYWSRLQELFSLINEGSESKDIPKKDLFIPPYNGGLFDPSKHEFLEKKRVGDLHIAKVIDLLSRSNGGFIDYSSLDIRDLGSIYEGLLEFKLKVAEEDMVLIKKKEREVWIPRKKAGKKRIRDDVKEGGLYLLTDKGERKATGSYYTPEYIVKYIVRSTLGPVVERKRKEAQRDDQKESDALLSINVLDPAMGSGHFLVEAVDFLTEPLLEAINNDVEKGLAPTAEYDPEWAKREIVSHCIYGVDLNPLAVELAKLSLWLKTIAKKKPLSFLDHRLKCGNSLIGSSLEDLPWHPKRKEKNKEQERLDISGFTKKLVDTTKKLTEISDDTLDNIRQKEEIFSKFKKTLEYDMMKTLADLRTSIYFGNEVDEETYGNYSGDAFFSTEKDWWRKKERDFAQKGTKLAEEKRFFHWELEFPEVFYEEGGLRNNPGFDIVLGNPPYVNESRENKELFRELRRIEYLKRYYEKGMDLFNFFIEIGIDLLKKDGYFGYIVPDYWRDRSGATKLRNKIFSESEISSYVNFREYKVFHEAQGHHSSIITLFKNAKMTTPRKTKAKILSEYDISHREAEKWLLSKKFEDLTYLLESGKVIFVSKELSQIIQKIKSFEFFRLEEFMNGIQTYADRVDGKGVFVLTEEEVSSLKLNSDEERLLRPFYYPKSIDRYFYRESNDYFLIYTNSSYREKVEKNPRKYRNIRAHLDKMQDVITSAFKPYGIHRGRDEYWFTSKSKIIGLRKTNYPAFVAISQPYFMDESVNYIIPPEDYDSRYIITVLNSSLAYFWFSLLKGHGAQLQVDIEIVKSLPIPKIEKEIRDRLANLAEQMIRMNQERNSRINDFLADLEGIVNPKLWGRLQKAERERSLYKMESCGPYVKEKSHKTHHLEEALGWNKKAFKDFVKVLSGRVQNLSDILKIYEKHASKVKRLKKEIEDTDRRIDALIFKLYELDEEEVEVILDTLGIKGEVKRDILEKYESVSGSI